jgi:hypothetical protein
MAWLRRTCVVLAGGTAAALVAFGVAAGIAVGAALHAAGITPCNAPGAQKDVVVAVLISFT